MTVVHYQRRPFDRGNFSIERVFSTVRRCLPRSIECRVAVCRHHGTRPWRMLYNMLEAVSRQGDVNHITGDATYLGIFLHKRRTVLTIHDCIGMYRLHGWRRRLFGWLWMSLPARRCAVVTVISENTRREVLRFSSCPADKIRIVPDPVGKEFQPAPRAFRAAMPVVLQIGGDTNKNIARVAAALRQIPCELHMVGHLRGEDRQGLEQEGIRYRVSSNLTDEQMLEAYRDCDLVVFASTYEGFGMPIIEAHAIGRPVVTSAIEPMTWVAGGAACLVDPFDPQSIRAGVLRVIEDAGYREELVRRGYENVKRFTAEAVAEAYTAIYQELAAAGSPAAQRMAAHTAGRQAE